MESGPLVSVIIPTCDRPGELAVCMAAILGQGGGIEVIAGDDGRVSPALPPGVRRVEGPRKGPGANRNAAARAARGQWLIFVDDDCVPLDGFLDAYRAAMAQAPPGLTVLFGMTRPVGDGAGDLMFEAPRNLKGTVPPPSCNFAMRRADFLESGGFDERYRISFEDMEFFSRLEAMGAGFRFVPEAAVEHPTRPLPGSMALAKRWEARVISTFDYGAGFLEVLTLLPRHVALVIAARYKDHPRAKDRLRAAFRFAAEFALVCWLLPGWIWKHGRGPRSVFWGKLGDHPPRFGL